MRGALWAAAALLAIAAAERRADTDFEFDEAPEVQPARARRPRRYVYDPQSPLCRELVCKKREVCLLRDAFTAQCATKKELLRRGDTIVAARRERVDDDVFYEARAPDRSADSEADRSADSEADRSADNEADRSADNEADRSADNEADSSADNEADRDDGRDLDRPLDRPPERCVGCGAAGGAQFVCGSDNRTYSSLCRLDLHNCVRRGAAVRLACRGFCPCRAPRRSPHRSPHRAAARRSRPAVTRGGAAPADARGSEGCELDKMANRLLDWFSVLMEEAAGLPPPLQGFPRDCKPEVRWMFSHLDVAGDGLLSHDDLYALRAYVPACDARGFYLPRQCHAALGVCWCVDAHGVERPASRTKGQPACPDERELEGGESVEIAEVTGDVQGRRRGGAGEAGAAGRAGDALGPDDDEDGAGSGDNELRF